MLELGYVEVEMRSLESNLAQSSPSLLELDKLQ